MIMTTKELIDELETKQLELDASEISRLFRIISNSPDYFGGKIFTRYDLESVADECIDEVLEDNVNASSHIDKEAIKKQAVDYVLLKKENKLISECTDDNWNFIKYVIKDEITKSIS